MNSSYTYSSKIISSENIVEYIKNRVSLTFKFNKKTKASLKFGVNNAIKYLERRALDDAEDKSLCLVFAFFNPRFQILWDLVVLKQSRHVRFYFVEDSYK